MAQVIPWAQGEAETEVCSESAGADSSDCNQKQLRICQSGQVCTWFHAQWSGQCLVVIPVSDVSLHLCHIQWQQWQWVYLKFWSDAAQVSMATSTLLGAMSWEGYPGWWLNILHRKDAWSLLHVPFLQLFLKCLVNLCHQVSHGVRCHPCSLAPLNCGNQDSGLWEKAWSMETVPNLAHVSHGAIMHQCDISTSSKSPSAHIIKGCDLAGFWAYLLLHSLSSQS